MILKSIFLYITNNDLQFISIYTQYRSFYLLYLNFDIIMFIIHCKNNHNDTIKHYYLSKRYK